jgi:acyl-CoA thioester hydrolase
LKKFEHKIRVRYGETDQMGFVYYGNYALYYEEVRTELIRSLGFSYKEMEQMGVMMPVVNMNTNYRKPALYDDEIYIYCWIKGSVGRKICFYSEIYNSNNELLNYADITLVFVDIKSGRAITCPHPIADALKDYIHV